jgi:HK97 family phage prohead protease
MSVLAHADNQIIDIKRQSFLSETKILNPDQGIVEAITSVTNIKDDVDDIILPGAYKGTLEKRKPKIVWSHSWELPVAKVLEIEEYMPGDARLPEKIQALGGGGLFVKMQFNMDTQTGKDAFSNVKFFGDENEWSIGYFVPSGDATFDKKTGVRKIKALELFECSPVLFGANAETVTMDVKKAISSHKTGTSDGEWDSSSMKTNLLEDITSYRKASAWVNPDYNPETKSAYAFIHHFVSDDGTVGDASTVACSTAIEVLNEGVHGVTISDADKEDVYQHLAKHLKDAGLEVPELKDLSGSINKHDFMGFDSNPSICVDCGGEKVTDFHNIEEKPYEVRKNGNQYCVYNSDTGKKVPGGCHDTRSEANDHMRALYANVEDAGKCGGSFVVSVSGATANAICEKDKGHNGDCGFNYQESNMAVKETEPIVKEPTTEPVVKTEGEAVEPIVETVEESEVKEPEVVETEVTETPEETEEKETQSSKYFDILLESIKSFEDQTAELSGENDQNATQHTLIVDAMKSQMAAFKSLVSMITESTAAEIEESGPQPVKTMFSDTVKVVEFDDGHIETTVLTDEEKASLIVDGVMTAANISVGTISATNISVGTLTDKESTDSSEKMYVNMTGSFEDISSRINTALTDESNLPAATVENSIQGAWVEATYPDNVLVCVYEYVEDSDGYIDLVGSRYFSYPYTISGDSVSLGDPTEVEVSAVLTPKDAEPDYLENKVVNSIEAKVGRTLSADNAEKIRKAVHGLIDVLVGAGIEMEEGTKSQSINIYDALKMENELLKLIADR